MCTTVAIVTADPFRYYLQMVPIADVVHKSVLGSRDHENEIRSNVYDFHVMYLQRLFNSRQA